MTTALLLASLFLLATPSRGGEIDLLAEVLQLTPGMSVADVGAGDGEWSEQLAARVGDLGRVYATEVDAGELEEIRRRLERSPWKNIVVVTGDQQTSGLEADCCDAILLRMVYHHFEDPAAMRADLHRALRPEGRIAIVDIRPQSHWRRLEDVPERGGHGIDPDDLIAEMSAAGFQFVQQNDEWNGDEERYCVVFRR